MNITAAVNATEPDATIYLEDESGATLTWSMPLQKNYCFLKCDYPSDIFPVTRGLLRIGAELGRRIGRCFTGVETDPSIIVESRREFEAPSYVQNGLHLQSSGGFDKAAAAVRVQLEAGEWLSFVARVEDGAIARDSRLIKTSPQKELTFSASNVTFSSAVAARIRQALKDAVAEHNAGVDESLKQKHLSQAVADERARDITNLENRIRELKSPDWRIA